jgi:hypothetical protein
MATVKEVKEILDNQFHGYYLEEVDGNNPAQYVIKVNEREIPILFEDDHIRIPSHLEMNYEQSDILSSRYYLSCFRSLNLHNQECLSSAAKFGYTSSELTVLFYDVLPLDWSMDTIYDSLCKNIRWLYDELQNIEANVYNRMLDVLRNCGKKHK